MASSSVAAAKAYLVTNIKLQAACADPVLVTYDDPGPYEPDDIVMVGRIEGQSIPGRLTGGLGVTGALTEEYFIEVTVSCYRGGDQAQTAFEQGCTLTDAVVAVVRADATLGGNLVESWPAQTRHEPAVWDADHKGRVAEVTLHIFCRTDY